MAWDTAADLLRELVRWEHHHAPYGGHWTWDESQGFYPVEVSSGGTPVARIGGHRVSVRRALWVAVWGELPASVAVHRVCVEPLCVRPVHGHADLAVGHADPHRFAGDGDDAHEDAEHVPHSMVRWASADPGVAGERRGRALLATGLTLPHGERRRTPRGELLEQLLATDPRRT